MLFHILNENDKWILVFYLILAGQQLGDFFRSLVKHFVWLIVALFRAMYPLVELLVDGNDHVERPLLYGAAMRAALQQIYLWEHQNVWDL